MVGKTNVAGARLRAVIAVTYPEGSVCTCSNGTKTLKARDTSGKALFNVSTGTWTVTATDGSRTTSNTVSITGEGQSESVTLAYKLVLYNYGNEYSEVTGGWAEHISSSDATVTKESEQLHLLAQNSSYAAATTRYSFDVTGYSVLKAEIYWMTYLSHSIKIRMDSADGTATLAIMTAVDGSQTSQLEGNGIYSLDISALSNGKPLIVSNSDEEYAVCRAMIKRVWFE